MRHHILFVLLVLLAVIGCTTKGERSATRGSVECVSEAVLADSLCDDACMLELYEHDSERVLAMIASAELSGGLSAFRADLLRATLFTLSVYNQRQAVAQQLCEQLLHHDSVQASLFYQQRVLELLVNASRMRHDDERWLRGAMQFYELLHRRGNEAEALRMKAEIGLVMTHLGQVDEGLAKIDEAIAHLDGLQGFDALLSYVLASKRKITVLREQGRHADVLPVARGIEQCLSSYAEHPADYADGSPREPRTAEERQDYCDFYGAQAMAFKAAAYAELGNKDSARAELSRFGKSSYAHSLDGRTMIAPTLGRLGDYAAMLAIYNEVEANLGSDTLRYDHAEILLARAEAAEAQGLLAQSLTYRKRYEQLCQTLNDRLHRSQTHHYAARYHAQEQQMEIERQNVELSRQNIYIDMGVLLMLLAVTFAAYFLRQKRILDHKNHVLLEQISEAMAHKEKATAPLPTVATEPPAADADLSSLTDEQLFQYLRDTILREQLYLNPVCDRQTITARFGISEKRVGAAFGKGSDYKSLASFVRDSRLEHACKLLRQHPEMTIGSVATASGFSNHTRFTADFKARYSVSPTEYRSLTT